MKGSILFLGTNLCPISIECLSRLLSEDYTIVSVITLKSKKNYFFHWLKEDIITTLLKRQSLAAIAKRASLPYFAIHDINSGYSVSLIRSFQPDIICSCIFRQKLRQSVIKIPDYGTINIHPSLLPKYRGPDPNFWVFKNGENITGVTVHYMDENFDTGDIIIQKSFEIPEGIDMRGLLQSLALISADLAVIAVESIFNKNTKRLPQINEEYYPSPTKKDYVIDITKDAKSIYNFVKGIKSLSPVLKINNREFQIKDAIDYSIVLHEKKISYKVENNIVYFYAKDGIVRLKLKSFTDTMLEKLGFHKIINFFQVLMLDLL